MHRSGVNPARKDVVVRDLIALGSDPECKRMLLQIFVEARGSDEDGRGAGYGYVVANTGATQVEWHDG